MEDSMRHQPISAATALVLTLIAVDPASAITHGEPDGNAHPYVGLALFYDESGTLTHRCTGTLIAPRVVLTAGHCTFGAAAAQVWFNAEVTPATVPGYPFSGGVMGTPYTHHGYDPSEGLGENSGFPGEFPNASDVGIVYLDEPVEMDTYGVLPDLGVLDALATRRGPDFPLFSVVGYGVQSIVPDFQADLVRYRGTVALVNLRNALTDGFNVQFTGSPGEGHGPGGVCFGDSGGPVFLGDTNIVVAVSTFTVPSLLCVGPGFAYRVDIANSRDFIDLFLEP
jgi:hypothetical protein